MRLIDADKLEIRKLAEFKDEYGDAVPVYGVAADDIVDAPTEQLWLTSSRWIKDRDNTYHCLTCGSEDSRSSLTGKFFRHCPNCGSRMEIGG